MCYGEHSHGAHKLVTLVPPCVYKHRFPLRSPSLYSESPAGILFKTSCSPIGRSGGPREPAGRTLAARTAARAAGLSPLPARGHGASAAGSLARSAWREGHVARRPAAAPGAGPVGDCREWAGPGDVQRPFFSLPVSVSAIFFRSLLLKAPVGISCGSFAPQKTLKSILLTNNFPLQATYHRVHSSF